MAAILCNVDANLGFLNVCTICNPGIRLCVFAVLSTCCSISVADISPIAVDWVKASPEETTNGRKRCLDRKDDAVVGPSVSASQDHLKVSSMVKDLSCEQGTGSEDLQFCNNLR